LLPEQNKSIFEILCEKLIKANQECGVSIPWYIMTSEDNHKDTIKFFEEHQYFGYIKEDITFFIQGELPMINTYGKILLDEEGFIKEAADGHGGVFEAMFKNGVMKDMKKRKIDWVFIGTVDNPLAKVADPLPIGIGVQYNSLSVGKSTVKKNPEERVGVFCKKNARPSVVEYTEITEEMSKKTDKNGELTYGELHMVCNVFNIKALEKIDNKKLPYHIAFKKAKYMDEKGYIIDPEKPNAYKFESFIFDSFEEINDMIILRVKREEEFAPVKNATGEDSPETARKLYDNYYNK